MKMGYFLLVLCLVLVVPAAADVGCSGVTASAPWGYGLLNVSTSPEGAVIFVDGASSSWLTQTPVSGILTVGTHSLMIMKYTGYDVVYMNVTVCNQQLTMVYQPLTGGTPAPTLAYINKALLSNISVATVTTTATAAPTGATATVSPLATTAAATPAATATATTVATRPGAPTAVPVTSPPASTGALNVTSIPAAATVYLDGSGQGIAPVTISGLAPGAHTLLLKLDGYSDLSMPVTITAGQTQVVAASLSPLTQAPAASPTTKTPGFAAVPAGAALAGAALVIRKIR